MARLILITILLFLCNNVILGQSKPKRDSSKDFRTEMKNSNKNVTSEPNKNTFKPAVKKKNRNLQHQHTQEEFWGDQDDVFHDAGTIVDYEDYLNDYPNGKYVDQAKARINEIELSAEQGSAESKYRIGRCYYDKKWDPNYQKAIYWFKKAADQGYAEAQSTLGSCYYEGHGLSQDYQQAIYWFKKAAEQGHAEAQFALGLCYYEGHGLSQDCQQAIYWFKKAADQGEKDAQTFLGFFYLEGKSVPQDYEQAALLFKKAVAQRQVKAQLGLGLCYLLGYGVSEDVQRGWYLIRKAADEGDEDAHAILNRVNEERAKNINKEK